MTKTRNFIESKMLTEIENRKNMEAMHFPGYPIKNSRLMEYYTLVGFINGLEWVLNASIGVGLHENTSEIKIKDVLANIIPHIANHISECECHACITNDVLQYFIRKQYKEEEIRRTWEEDKDEG
jgi:hypothetical protein